MRRFRRSVGFIPRFRPENSAGGDETFPGAAFRRRAGDDPNENHILPEIVHDTQQDQQGKWLVIGIISLVLAAGGGFWLGRTTRPMGQQSAAVSYDDATAAAVAPTAEAVRHRVSAHAGEPQGAAVVAAAKPASGTMFVHRMNSDVRARPAYDAKILKKEPKGAQVQLLALSGKWAEMQDGALKGWMRASVLKDTPPGQARAKKSAD
jgi:hypothetical protein